MSPIYSATEVIIQKMCFLPYCNFKLSDNSSEMMFQCTFVIIVPTNKLNRSIYYTKINCGDQRLSNSLEIEHWSDSLKISKFWLVAVDI